MLEKEPGHVACEALHDQAYCSLQYLLRTENLDPVRCQSIAGLAEGRLLILSVWQRSLREALAKKFFRNEEKGEC